MKDRKFFLAFFTAILLAASPVFAAIVVEEDGTQKGIVEKVNFQGGGNVSVSGSVATISPDELLNSRGDDAELSLASSSTVITDASLPYSIITKNVGGGGGLDSTGIGTTLANATRDGQSITIIITGLQSGGSWIVTPTTKTGFRKITFDTKGDTATLLFVNSTVGWIIVANSGAVIDQA